MSNWLPESQMKKLKKKLYDDYQEESDKED